MTTITRVSDSATTTPTIVDGYAAAYEGANVVHTLIGGGIAVTLVPQALRSGTLQLVYDTEADAWEGVNLHLGTDTFTLSDADVPSVNMLYAAGTVSPALEDQTRAVWVVSVDFQELEP